MPYLDFPGFPLSFGTRHARDPLNNGKLSSKIAGDNLGKFRCFDLIVSTNLALKKKAFMITKNK